MVPTDEDPVEPSTILWNEMARQTPGGGLRSPATRSLSGPSAVPAAEPPPSDAAAATDEASARSRWQRLRTSVWSPVLFKAAGACLGLSSLALIGAASMQEVPGVAVTAAGTEWLAGEPESNEDTHALPAAVGQGAPQQDQRALDGATANRAAHGSPKGSRAGSDPPGAPAPCGPEEKKPAPPQGVTPDGRIVLNRATAEEFTRLPGIGQRRAEQIVALRERLGRFKRITDLLRVKGIGPKSLRRFTTLVVLDPPEPEPEPQPDGDG